MVHVIQRDPHGHLGFLLALLALALLALALLARWQTDESLHGQATRIVDGDTFVLDTGSQALKIRLSEIDTPERNQPYGLQAKNALSTLIDGKAVQVREAGRDKYRRTLGRVFVEGRDVNAALVEQGAAWVYRQYSHDQRLLRLEEQARTARRGLWGLPDPIAPWDWRKSRKSKKDEVLSEAERSAGCQPDKRTCKAMRDCAEARFYLETCGLSRLDRDRDGIPCESLCR